MKPDAGHAYYGARYADPDNGGSPRQELLDRYARRERNFVGAPPGGSRSTDMGSIGIDSVRRRAAVQVTSRQGRSLPRCPPAAQTESIHVDSRRPAERRIRTHFAFSFTALARKVACRKGLSPTPYRGFESLPLRRIVKDRPARKTAGRFTLGAPTRRCSPRRGCAPAVFPKAVLACGCARQGKTRFRRHRQSRVRSLHRSSATPPAPSTTVRR